VCGGKGLARAPCFWLPLSPRTVRLFAPTRFVVNAFNHETKGQLPMIENGFWSIREVSSDTANGATGARVILRVVAMSSFVTHGACTARQAVMADPMERQGVTRSVHHARRKKLSRHGASAVREIVEGGGGSRFSGLGEGMSLTSFFLQGPFVGKRTPAGTAAAQLQPQLQARRLPDKYQ